jgi:membrane protease YdiL (CAAX protease family)
MEISEKKSVSLNAWVGLFVAAGLLPPLLKALAGALGAFPEMIPFVAYAGTVVLMLGCVLIVLSRLGADFAASLRGYAENILRDLLAGTALAAALILLGAAMSHFGVTGQIGDGPGTMLKKFSVIFPGPAGIAAAYLVGAVLAPLYEELFFRRLLYVSLRKKYSLGRAVFLGGLLFGLLHIHALIYASLVGIALCLAYEKTRRLDVVIFAHVINNFVSTSLKIFGS